MKKIKTRLILIALLPAGLVLFYLAPGQSSFIEKFYSNSLYKAFAQALSLITGLVPFSVAEVGVVLLTVLLPVVIVRFILKLVKTKDNRLRLLGSAGLSLLAASGAVYFTLVALWSMNYNRLSFSEIAGLKIEKTSVSDLTRVCEALVEQANQQRTLVTEDGNGIMTVSKGYRDVFARAGLGYGKASRLYPELKGRYGRPKPVILSKAMSYTGIEGIFCPFTVEANVNVAIPQSSIPSTTCHEMAHQRGFAREDEANYISYVACTLHPDSDFQYSGTLLALIYSMNALYEHSKSEYRRVAENYSPGVIRDLKATGTYWEQHEGPVEKISNKVNNAYLKANKQEDGVYSYGRMVDLLIASYRKNNP